MPLVEVSIVEGRPPERIRAMIDRVTDAVEMSLEAPRSSIRVIVREIPPTHWAAGGQTIAERTAASAERV